MSSRDAQTKPPAKESLENALQAGWGLIHQMERATADFEALERRIHDEVRPQLCASAKRLKRQKFPHRLHHLRRARWQMTWWNLGLFFSPKILTHRCVDLGLRLLLLAIWLGWLGLLIGALWLALAAIVGQGG